MNWNKPPAVAGLAVLLSACAVGPDYHRPELALPAHFRDGGADWSSAAPGDAQPRGDWWQAFGDPDLDALEHQAADANLDLRIAASRWRQAEALTRQASAARWPTISGNAGVTRSGAGRNAAAGGSASGTADSIGASLAWELDLWGRVSRTVEADVASAQAARGDLETARLSLQAQLATSYFTLRQVDAQRRLLEAAVEAYQRSLDLTRNRYAGGVASRADVAQATTQLEATRAQRVDLDIQRGQLEHAIAVLLGRTPQDFSLAPRDGTELATPPAIAPQLPSTLLQRRPDVAAAERRAAAANAQIGVAQAAFFPALQLDASAGFRSSSLSNLLSVSSRVWSVGPSLAATLFDAGARSAAKAQAQEGFEQAADTYRKSVLGALQDVDDSLVALQTLASEADVEEAALAAAVETLQLTTNQYKAGTVSYLNVISAQAAELGARQNRLNIEARRLTATVQLIKSLGGGWNGG